MSLSHTSPNTIDVQSSIAVISSDTIGWSSHRKLYVETYVKNLQKILRLRDWKISVDWRKFADEDQAQTLIHELLHCHLFALDNLASDTVDALSSKSAGKVFEVALEAAVECTTDTLADVLLPFVPNFELPNM